MLGRDVTMKLLSNAVFTLVIFSLSGCNISSSEVKATYKNTFTYQNQSCNELNSEKLYVENQIQKMAFVVDNSKSSQDLKLAFGTLFWPSYFVIDNNNQEAKKLSILKGEYNALYRTIKYKKCNL